MTVLLKNINEEIKEKWNEVRVSVSRDVQEAYIVSNEDLMEQIVDALSKNYKVHYQDEDVINIKVDRRKNISSIEMDIRETVEGIVGGRKISDILFKYRTLDGMITIERRR